MSDLSQINPVGSTALMIACLRAMEMERPDKLFEDRFAPLFVHERIDTQTRGLEARFPVFPAAIRVRTRWCDDVLERAMDEGITQVVVLGAGCDTRAERFSRAGVTFYEVDQPGVLAFKAARLAQAGISYRAVAAPVDYTAPGLLEALVALGLDPARPTFVLWEGNVYYLPKSVISSVLQTLAASFPHLILALDYFGPEVIEGTSAAPGMREVVGILEHMGAPWTGWIADAASLATRCGLDLVEEREFRSEKERMVPDLELGADLDVEYSFCIMARRPASA